MDMAENSAQRAPRRHHSFGEGNSPEICFRERAGTGQSSGSLGLKNRQRHKVPLRSEIPSTELPKNSRGWAFKAIEGDETHSHVSELLH